MLNLDWTELKQILKTKYTREFFFQEFRIPELMGVLYMSEYYTQIITVTNNRGGIKWKPKWSNLKTLGNEGYTESSFTSHCYIRINEMEKLNLGLVKFFLSSFLLPAKKKKKKKKKKEVGHVLKCKNLR